MEAALKGAIVDTATGLTLRALPRIAKGVKRLLLGRRSINLDGNTLDTTLQLLLATQRAVGGGYLVSNEDVITARSRLDGLTASFKQDIKIAAVNGLSISGPAGPIPARHYRPDASRDGSGRPPAELLVFYRGG